MRIPIRNVGAGSKVPPRVFDLQIEGENVDIIVKLDKDKYEKVPWRIIEYQVKAAMEMQKKQNKD